jgi:hypothetical protein
MQTVNWIKKRLRIVLPIVEGSPSMRRSEMIWNTMSAFPDQTNFTGSVTDGRGHPLFLIKEFPSTRDFSKGKGKGKGKGKVVPVLN